LRRRSLCAPPDRVAAVGDLLLRGEREGDGTGPTSKRGEREKEGERGGKG